MTTAADGATDAAQPQGMSMGMIILVYGGLFAVMYFVFFRPQSKRRKAEEKMRNSIEVGDEITTIGGICGRIVSIKDDDTYVIETGTDRSKLKIKKWAIGSNETIKEATAEESPKKGLFGFLKK
jgi:preprotein translocase subunit YajC